MKPPPKEKKKASKVYSIGCCNFPTAGHASISNSSAGKWPVEIPTERNEACLCKAPD